MDQPQALTLKLTIIGSDGTRNERIQFDNIRQVSREEVTEEMFVVDVGGKPVNNLPVTDTISYMSMNRTVAETYTKIAATAPDTYLNYHPVDPTDRESLRHIDGYVDLSTSVTMERMWVHEDSSLEVQIYSGDVMKDRILSGPLKTMTEHCTTRCCVKLLEFPENQYGLIGIYFDMFKRGRELFHLGSVYADRSHVNSFVAKKVPIPLM